MPQKLFYASNKSVEGISMVGMAKIERTNYVYVQKTYKLPNIVNT